MYHGAHQRTSSLRSQNSSTKSERHPTQDCPNKDTIGQNEIKCANCNGSGHRPTWKGCPKYQRYIGQEVNEGVQPEGDESTQEKAPESEAPVPPKGTAKKANKPKKPMTTKAEATKKPPKRPQAKSSRKGSGSGVASGSTAKVKRAPPKVDMGSTNDPLRIISWNTQSVNKNIEGLREVAETYRPHIILLQETWLTPNHESPQVPGYSWERADRPNKTRGGVAILIHNTVPFIRTAPPAGLVHSEVVGGNIQTGEGTLHISSIYTPPNQGRKGELQKVLRQHPHFIIAGDYNAHWEAWGSKKSNNTGRYLDALVNEYSFNIHIPPVPTRMDKKDRDKDSVLDYAITHGPLTDVALQVLPNMGSDHYPLLIQPLHLNLFIPPKLKIKRDWDRLAADLHFINWPTGAVGLTPAAVGLTPAAVEEAAEHFTAELQAILLNSGTAIRLRAHERRLLPLHIRVLRKERNQLLKSYKRTRDPTTKPHANQVGRQVQKEIKAWEEERTLQTVSEIDDPGVR
ncbi:hypothetical protein ONE63_011168 [Megalurothrips usitatus]|uniref:Endonuclease/exonuclease/phosphatase domain-containing protein n=1 Tax=Megalurothrips usitatus TaxID=439358 RepID=A0AAV7X3Z8_9NEOP|nr:hypothetical protein ONE63_011168 [Megalurothrips usitatus]